MKSTQEKPKTNRAMVRARSAVDQSKATTGHFGEDNNSSLDSSVRQRRASIAAILAAKTKPNGTPSRPSSSQGLLKRRQSTPNTLDAIVNLFEGDSKGNSPTLRRRPSTAVPSSHQTENVQPAFQLNRNVRPNSALCYPRPFRPATSAFLELVSGSSGSTAIPVPNTSNPSPWAKLQPSGEQSRPLRPSTAPTLSAAPHSVAKAPSQNSLARPGCSIEFLTPSRFPEEQIVPFPQDNFTIQTLDDDECPTLEGQQWGGEDELPAVGQLIIESRGSTPSKSSAVEESLRPASATRSRPSSADRDATKRMTTEAKRPSSGDRGRPPSATSKKVPPTAASTTVQHIRVEEAPVTSPALNTSCSSNRTMLHPHQERFHLGRPLSGKNRNRLIPFCGPTYSEVAHGVQHSNDSTFLAELMLDPLDIRLQALAGDQEVAEEAVQAMQHLMKVTVAALAHADAAEYCAINQFPLDRHSPWSRVVAGVMVSKETMIFHLTSPASVTVGGRIFSKSLAFLNAGVSAGRAPLAERVERFGGALERATLRVVQFLLTPCVAIYGATLIVSLDRDRPLIEAPRLHANEIDVLSSVSTHETIHELVSFRQIPTGQVKLEANDLEGASMVQSFLRDEWGSVGPSSSPKASSQAATSLSRCRSLRSMRGLPCAAGRLDASRMESSTLARSLAMHDGDSPEAKAPSPAEVNSENLGRVSLFGHDGAKFVTAVEKIRKLSSVRIDADESPTLAFQRRRSIRNSESMRKSTSFCRGNASRRLRIAVIISVSTYADSSIPSCPAMHQDAIEVQSLLKAECGFDIVYLLSSFRPDGDDRTPTMKNIKAVADEITLRYLINSVVEPSVFFIVFARGCVGRLGSVAGIQESVSARVVPYPSVAYDDTRAAQQPSLALKLAILENASVTALRSTEVLTPEIFASILNANGITFQPTVFFDVWPCEALRPSSREGSEACGFCGLYSKNTETDFTGVYHSRVGGLAAYYFKKLLCGGILRAGCKGHLQKFPHGCKDFAKSPIPNSLKTILADGSDLGLTTSDIHLYLVARLMKRNCNVLYSVVHHIATTAAELESQEGGGDKLLANLETVISYSRLALVSYAPSKGSMHAQLLGIAAALGLLTPVSTAERETRFLYKLFLEAPAAAKPLPLSPKKAKRAPFQFHFDLQNSYAFMTFLGHTLRTLLYPNVFKLEKYLDRGREADDHHLLSSKLCDRTFQKKEAVPSLQPRTWHLICHCSRFKLVIAKHRPFTDACVRIRDSLLRLESWARSETLPKIFDDPPFFELEPSEHDFTILVTVYVAQDKRMQEFVAETAFKLFVAIASADGGEPQKVDMSGELLQRITIATLLQLLLDITGVVAMLEAEVAFSRQEFQKIDRAMRMQSIRSLCEITHLEQVFLRSSPLCETSYAATRRIQVFWSYFVNLRRCWKEYRRIQYDTEPNGRQDILDAELGMRINCLEPELQETLVDGLSLEERRVRHELLCAENNVAQELLWPRLQHLWLALENSRRQEMILVEATQQMEQIEEPFARDLFVIVEWELPFIARLGAFLQRVNTNANDTVDESSDLSFVVFSFDGPLRRTCFFRATFLIAMAEMYTRFLVDHERCCDTRRLWDQGAEFFEFLGFGEDDVVIAASRAPFVPRTTF